MVCTCQLVLGHSSHSKKFTHLRVPLNPPKISPTLASHQREPHRGARSTTPDPAGCQWASTPRMSRGGGASALAGGEC
jgi:hypothetical protein